MAEEATTPQNLEVEERYLC